MSESVLAGCRRILCGRLPSICLRGVGSREELSAESPPVPGPEKSSTEYYCRQLSPVGQELTAAFASSPLQSGPSLLPVEAVLQDIPAATVPAEISVRRDSRGSFEIAACTGWMPFARREIGAVVVALTADYPALSWLVETEIAAESVCTVSVPDEALRGMSSGETRTLGSCQAAFTEVSFGLSPFGMKQATTDAAADGERLFAATGNLAGHFAAAAAARREIGALQGRSAVQKLRACHDWICRHFRYADSAGARYRMNWRGYQTAWSGLAQRETVCTGYARSFKLLCDLYGVPCIIVAGMVHDGPHVWNYVELDGQWFGVDCTWDAGPEGTVHNHFLRGQSFLLTHAERTYRDYPFLYPTLSSQDYAAGGI